MRFKMTHFYVQIPSEKAYRFLKAVSKWSDVEFDDKLVIPENTEFEVIYKMAEDIIRKQFLRSQGSEQAFDDSVYPNIVDNIYDAEGNITNYVCRSINSTYFWQGVEYLRIYPNERSCVVYTKCIDSIYVVRRLDNDVFEWMSIFV